MGSNVMKQENGYMFIQLDKSIFLPGEIVTGKIFLRTSVPVEAARMNLHIKGSEKGAFTRREKHGKRSVRVRKHFKRILFN